MKSQLPVCSTAAITPEFDNQMACGFNAGLIIPRHTPKGGMDVAMGASWLQWQQIFS